MLFNVSDLDNPIMVVNNKVGESSNAVQISEGEKLRLSCYVNGNPVPIITLKKEASDSIISQSPSSDWLNYTTSSKCSDMGTYKCTGESTKFNNTEKMFGIYVICKFSQLKECCENVLHFINSIQIRIGSMLIFCLFFLMLLVKFESVI